ncbi:MAG: hypothetical protein R3345_15965 [Fulvivirga sp.]|nr:hypothetical protein [Fulvivirga sp.]
MKSKHLYSSLICFFMVVVLLVSCADDDALPSKPVITATLTSDQTVRDDSIIVEAGDSVNFDIKISTSEDLKLFSVADDTGKIILEMDKNSLGIETDQKEIPPFSVTIIPESKGKAQLIFTATDELNQRGQTVKDLIVVDKPISAYSTLLFVPTADENSKSFFSTNLGKSLTKNEVDNAANSSSVDFGYAINATEDFWLASPVSYPEFTGYNLTNWTVRNTTTFKDVALTAEEFLAIDTQSGLKSLFEGGIDPADHKSAFEVGAIYAFRLDDKKGAKYGALRVVDAVDGNIDGDLSDENDFIELDVLIEQ